MVRVSPRIITMAVKVNEVFISVCSGENLIRLFCKLIQSGSADLVGFGAKE